MSLEIKRLHLASLQGVGGGLAAGARVRGHPPRRHGARRHRAGGPQQVLDDWQVVNRSMADASAELGMSPPISRW